MDQRDGSAKGGDTSEVERFRAFAEHAPELIVELGEGGRTLYASPSVRDLLGYEPEAFLKLDPLSLVHPEDVEEVARVYHCALETRARVETLHRGRHRDGRWIWLQDTAQAYRTSEGATHVVVFTRNVDALKAAEWEQTRQLEVETRVAAFSRRFLALGSDEIDAALREALVETGELAGADRSYLVTFERSSDGSFPIYEWCASGIEPYTGGRCPWAENRLLRGEVLHYAALDELPADADPRDLLRRGVRSLLAIPVRSGSRTIGAIGFETMRRDRRWCERDITLLRLIGEIFTSALRRRQTENALRESRDQLVQAQKLEAVGRLAGGIAHDFNNLLTVILGFSRPLLRELAEGDPVREDVSEIHGAAERAAALTRQLLTFSRRQAFVSQPVDLDGTLTRLEPLISRLLGEDVELVLEFSSGAARVQGDPHQFEQVVLNLAANARDAMPRGGSLLIHTRQSEANAPDARRLGLRGPGRYVVLSVSDTGHGIDEATRSQIFDPFFTTKEPGKGTGLGLAIAYGVVDQAGGAIRVRDAEGGGTTFEIWLPVVEAELPESRSAPEIATRRGNECVLLVEDEPAVRRLVQRVLTEQGYRVLEASNGSEALEVASRCGPEIDAVVTDVVMPRLGGPELVRRLRAEHSSLGALFMSGYPGEHDDADEKPMPEGERIMKPFAASTLLSRLRKVLDGARASQPQKPPDCGESEEPG